jgi:hypothetical protein
LLCKRFSSDPSVTILLQCCPNAASESANDMALSNQLWQEHCTMQVAQVDKVSKHETFDSCNLRIDY